MRSVVLCFFVSICIIASNAFAIPPKRTDKEYSEARVHGAQTFWDLTVIDDDGLPVADAEIAAVFECRGSFHHAKFKTDRRGKAAVKGLTTGESIVITITKNGYYNSHIKTCYLRFAENKPVLEGRWLPWGEKKEIRLRKIKQPITLSKSDLSLMVPDTNLWFGIDLEYGDWVTPYGKGVITDCVVRVSWDGQPPYQCKFCKTDVCFLEPYSGVYDVANISESEMQFPYRARTNAVYGQSFEYYNRKDGKKIRESRLPDFSRVARVRCEVSEKGELLKANYCGLRCIEASPGPSNGKAILGLTSVFNPTPNDTNLEAKK